MVKSVYIKDILSSLGYSEEHFSADYFVQIDGSSALKFDYVAFSDKYLKDISTSCIAVQEVRDDKEEDQYVEGARYLAAPIMIISKKDHVRFWSIAPQKSRLLSDNEENIVHLYFEKNRFEFMSDQLIDAKMGNRQLSIFEAVGLIDFSRNATCRILSEEFEKGLIAAKKYLKKKKNVNGRDLNNITSITMHVISALIINSKVKPEKKIPDIFELLEDLSHTYPEYFSDKVMLKYGEDLLCKIYDSLNRSINYQSVDHELLGYFYESTLLQLSEQKAENIRKEFGIYYTPKVLSQEIVLSIPFENIPVDSRFVLDGTCGSGSLLLSACKRLEALASYEKKEFERHEYLTNMIQGYDIDEFASEVARLSLLLYSLPYGNRWNICAGDLLHMNKSKQQIPYIILGNPPYEEVRGNTKKAQKAMAFLDKYLDWLHEDGYLGIILPESFLQNDSCKEQREKLLKEFDIMELWMLPGQIFRNNCPTTVIIAQKKQGNARNVTKIKMLVRNRRSVRSYFKWHRWDFEFFVSVQMFWKKEKGFKIKISPIEGILQKITKSRKCIGNITKSVMGIMLPSKYQFSEMKFDGWVPYIANANDFRKYIMSQKMIDGAGYLNYHMSEEEEREIKEKYKYKGVRLRRDYESVYSSQSKILIKMSSTPGEIDCISALVDEDGYYPGHSFFAMVSEDESISNCVICALINSKLINAYVRRECVKRTLTTQVVRSIPVPEFNEAQIEKIEKCYQEIKEAYTLEDIEKVNELQEKVDDIIFDAFELKQAERDQVKMLYAVYTEGRGNEAGVLRTDGCQYVTGQVEAIDLEEMYCRVYLVESGEKKIEIIQSMPGWFLREGAEFSAKYHAGILFDIKPLVYSYLADDEILTMLFDETSTQEEDLDDK